MGAMSKEAVALRAEVERAVVKAVERLGPGGLDRDAIVKRFLGRGPTRSTIYRWISDIVASGTPGQHVVRQVRKAAERRAKRQPDPAAAAAEVAAEVVEAAPAPLPRVEQMVDGARSVVDVVERLNACITIAEKLIRHAETAEGGVRNSKLMLNASEHLRRSLQTVVQLHAAINDVARVDAFNADIIATVRAVHLECPQASELILRRTTALAAKWQSTERRASARS